MSDTVFRSKQEPQVEETPKANIQPNSPIDDHVETPYTDSKDFLDNYFKIGSEWHDQDSNFYPEVKLIDSYIKNQIDDGSVANDQEAVGKILKGIERINNLHKESRSVVRLEVVANYVEFLMKNSKLKSNLRRYGN